MQCICQEVKTAMRPVAGCLNISCERSTPIRTMRIQLNNFAYNEIPHDGEKNKNRARRRGWHGKNTLAYRSHAPRAPAATSWRVTKRPKPGAVSNRGRLSRAAVLGLRSAERRTKSQRRARRFGVLRKGVNGIRRVNFRRHPTCAQRRTTTRAPLDRRRLFQRQHTQLHPSRYPVLSHDGRELSGPGCLRTQSPASIKNDRGPQRNLCAITPFCRKQVFAPPCRADRQACSIAAGAFAIAPVGTIHCNTRRGSMLSIA